MTIAVVSLAFFLLNKIYSKSSGKYSIPKRSAGNPLATIALIISFLQGNISYGTESFLFLEKISYYKDFNKLFDFCISN